MPWVVDPNIAYMTLLVGLWLSITAAYMAGTGFLEVGAVIVLVVALALLAALPTSWGGVVIILIGTAIFFGLPFLKPRAALLALGGLVLQGVGSLLLFPVNPVSPLLISAVLLVSLGYFYFLLLPALNTYWHKGELLDDAPLVGEIGYVLQPLKPVGVVRVRGEAWTGRAVPADSAIAEGQMIRVIEHQDLTLFVEPVKQKRDDANNQPV